MKPGASCGKESVPRGRKGLSESPEVRLGLRTSCTPRPCPHGVCLCSSPGDSVSGVSTETVPLALRKETRPAAALPAPAQRAAGLSQKPRSSSSGCGLRRAEPGDGEDFSFLARSLPR